MPPNKPEKPHELAVIFGHLAVHAYLNGERRSDMLRRLGGEIRRYRFETIPELNAFIIGIEEAAGFDDAICVDDL